MKMLQKGKVSYLASQMLEAQEPAQPNICLRHGFSTRMGGVSTAEHLKEMNFGFRRGWVGSLLRIMMEAEYLTETRQTLW